GEDVRLGCVAALRAELAGQLIKEIKIEVHSGVGWAIEGPDCRSCMSTRCIDAASEGLNLDFLIALHCVFPVVLDRVRVCDEPAIAVGVDIRAAGALGELAGVARLFRPRLLSAAEDVARIQAEKQGEHQHDKSAARASPD